jgi:hypothetical protein
MALPDSRVGISHALPFSSALWKYVSNQTGMESSHLRKDASKPRMEEHTPRRRVDRGHVGPLHEPPVDRSCTLRKEILMLSLSPSIYGNKYSVLGSS